MRDSRRPSTLNLLKLGFQSLKLRASEALEKIVAAPVASENRINKIKEDRKEVSSRTMFINQSISSMNENAIMSFGSERKFAQLNIGPEGSITKSRRRRSSRTKKQPELLKPFDEKNDALGDRKSVNLKKNFSSGKIEASEQEIDWNDQSIAREETSSRTIIAQRKILSAPSSQSKAFGEVSSKVAQNFPSMPESLLLRNTLRPEKPIIEEDHLLTNLEGEILIYRNGKKMKTLINSKTRRLAEVHKEKTFKDKFLRVRREIRLRPPKTNAAFGFKCIFKRDIMRPSQLKKALIDKYGKNYSHINHKNRTIEKNDTQIISKNTSRTGVINKIHRFFTPGSSTSSLQHRSEAQKKFKAINLGAPALQSKTGLYPQLEVPNRFEKMPIQSQIATNQRRKPIRFAYAEHKSNRQLNVNKRLRDDLGDAFLGNEVTESGIYLQRKSIYNSNNMAPQIPEEGRFRPIDFKTDAYVPKTPFTAQFASMLKKT